jgi:hypothetical protein
MLLIPLNIDHDILHEKQESIQSCCRDILRHIARQLFPEFHTYLDPFGFVSTCYFIDFQSQKKPIIIFNRYHSL